MDRVQQVEGSHNSKEYAQLYVCLTWQGRHKEAVEKQGGGRQVGEEWHPVFGPAVLVASDVDDDAEDEHNATSDAEPNDEPQTSRNQRVHTGKCCSDKQHGRSTNRAASVTEHSMGRS